MRNEGADALNRTERGLVLLRNGSALSHVPNREGNILMHMPSLRRLNVCKLMTINFRSIGRTFLPYLAQSTSYGRKAGNHVPRSASSALCWYLRFGKQCRHSKF